MDESVNTAAESIGELAILALTPPPNPKQRRHPTIFGPAPNHPFPEDAKTRTIRLLHAMQRKWRTTRQGFEIYDSDIKVYQCLAIVFHSPERGWISPSYDLIAEKAGVSRRTVARSIKRLEATRAISHVWRLRRIRNAKTDQHGRPLNPIIPVRDRNGYVLGNIRTAPECHGGTAIRPSHFTLDKRDAGNQKYKPDPEKPMAPTSPKDGRTAPCGVRAPPNSPQPETLPTRLAELFKGLRGDLDANTSTRPRQPQPDPPRFDAKPITLSAEARRLMGIPVPEERPPRRREDAPQHSRMERRGAVKATSPPRRRGSRRARP